MPSTIPATARPFRPESRGFAKAIGSLLREEDEARLTCVLEWLASNFERQPSLARAAERAHLSQYHFQRLFRRAVGLSPKKYIQFLTLARARTLLDRSRSVLDAAVESGLSGPGRLHDLFIHIEAMTPGEYKSRGQGLVVRYGMHPSPFGVCVVLRTDRGVCGLGFAARGSEKEVLTDLSRGLESASFREDAHAAAEVVRMIFQEAGGDIALCLRATPFRIKVWEALLAIPPGCIITYSDLARKIRSPRSSRAVGNAVAANPIAWLIPCHRVILASGVLGRYRWGPGRKLAMLSLETGLEDSES